MLNTRGFSFPAGVKRPGRRLQGQVLSVELNDEVLLKDEK
jgi:hypothetical protein